MKSPIKSDNSVSLFVCGDILNRSENKLICSSQLASVISSADYSVCNFEAPIEGYGKPEIKPGLNLSQRADTIDGLKQQGFNLILLGNNHMMDFGRPGLAATLKRAVVSEIETLGAGLDLSQAYRPLIKTIKGIKIGMLNACEAQFGEIDSYEDKPIAGYAWINHSLIEKNIIWCKSECDFVILFAHAGLENYSIPQKEWRQKYRHFCDLGVDIIIGSHPHVPQGYEVYQQSVIFYSLGNFFFETQKSKAQSDSSFAVWISLNADKSFNFKPVQHCVLNGVVSLTPKELEINIEDLNKLLEDEYDKRHDSMVLEVFKRIRKSMAFSSVLPIPVYGSLGMFLRLIYYSLIRKEHIKHKELYLLHLFKNESYYYVIKNGLQLMANQKYHRHID